jgi:hypothetical protein
MNLRGLGRKGPFVAAALLFSGAGCGSSERSAGQRGAPSNPNSNPGANTPNSDATNEAGPGGGQSPGDGGGPKPGLVNPAPGSKFFVGANFWNIDWQGQNDFFKPGVDFAATTDPWRADFLAELAPYSVLRFMDWNLINEASNPQADWQGRKKKEEAQNSPVAFEWQIDLCNRTKKDYWLNIPWQADASYVANLASLVHSKLDPELRVYVEWANEVWNGAFPTADYAKQRGQSLNLPGDDKAASYQVQQSVQGFAAFEAIFGKGSPRLVKVLAGMAAWTGPCEAQMSALTNSTINPDGIKPDVYAIAPYLMGTSMQELNGSLATVSTWVKNSVTCAKAANLKVISYEGGTDSWAGNCNALQVDPGMRTLYSAYLDTLADAGMTGPFVQYTHSGSCWGLKVKTGDSMTAAPKYAGLLDWVAAHP